MSSIKDSLKKAKIRKKISSSEPKIISSDPGSSRREIAESVLPEGAALEPRKANYWGGTTGFGGFGGSAMFHTQRPYMPDFDSPDRQWYPEDRVQANKYWRLFYKTDPMFGTAVEMYSTMMTSDYDITLENEQDSSIKRELSDMCDEVNLQTVLQNMVKEFLVIGEAVPHCFFNNEKGIWDYVAFHDPDFIDVIDPPMINSDPLIYFVPDDDLRDFFNSSDPAAYEVKKKLPVEFISKVLARQKIRLSPLNCSFVARKLHPYDERGTSLASRLWRINMVEDAVYNSTISIYRRHANAIKVIKVGDPQTGYIPSQETEQKLLNMVTQAEIDPSAWISCNYATNFESWGGPERAITISKEQATIENIKLIALGLSKSFMSGEVSFSSAKSGLQVFLRRLLSMRQFFESTWIYPKFFKPIIEIHDWQRSTTAEVKHRIKVKRTAQEAKEKGTAIVPKIKWKNKLDSQVDSDLLQALLQLKNLGFDVSLNTVGSAVGLDWKDETIKRSKEFLERSQILDNTLGAEKKKEFEQAAQPSKAPGGPGAGSPPAGGKPSPGGKPPAGTGPGTGVKPPSTPPGNSDTGGPSNEPIEAPGNSAVGD